MKTLLTLFLSITFFTTKAITETTTFSGAWQSKDALGNTMTMICSDKYLMFAIYDLSQKNM